MTAEPNVKPFDWLKQLPPSILQADSVPLFGRAPPFPWEQLSKELGLIFQTEIHVTCDEMEWKSKEHELSGFGTEPVIFSCAISPLEGSLWWVMAKSDLISLMHLILTKEVDEFNALDPNFEKGFSHYMAAHVMNLISKLDFDKNLTYHLQEETAIPQELGFCIDVIVTLLDKTIRGRVIIPQELLNSWKDRHANRKLADPYNISLAQKLQAIAHLEAGYVNLSRTDFDNLKSGDFVMLDRCSYEPDSDKGRVMITIDGKPMYRARLKQGNLKILEFPLYHEVEAPMENNKKEEDEFEEEEIPDEESEFDEDFEEETVEETVEEKEETLAEKTPAPPKKEAPVSPKKEMAPQATVVPSQETLKPSEIPVNMVIEVGRLAISFQKLLELQPGNVLELDIHPENGVDLMVNGRRIGKGELLKIGEVLGVRILDIG